MASWPSCSTNGQKYCFWLYFGYHGKILKDLKFFKESRTCSWFLELQYFQIRVGWWWVISTTVQNCGSNRWTSTHFSNSKDTCTKIQITFGRFQSSSNPWTSKGFQIRPQSLHKTLSSHCKALKNFQEWYWERKSKISL